MPARLLEPELQKTGTHYTSFGIDYVTSHVLAALALIDLRRAIEQVEALPDDPTPDSDTNATKNSTRMSVAKLLALHGTDRWQHVYEYFLYLWTPDQRYL